MISFKKYDCTGNDFIVLDLRATAIDISLLKSLAPRLCHRRFGIGADGIMVISKSINHDFHLRIINNDGSEAGMCANGARASIEVFCLSNKTKECSFEMSSGIYQGKYEGEMSHLLFPENLIKKNKHKKFDFNYIKNQDFIEAGIPHMVLEVSSFDEFDFYKEGALIRNSKQFPLGTNVNFYLEKSKGVYEIRTFERGVEGETFSCGTGIIATSFCEFNKNINLLELDFKTKGGLIKTKKRKGFLEYAGVVNQVFEGSLDLEKI